jgi:hypothetical protein
VIDRTMIEPDGTPNKENRRQRNLWLFRWQRQCSGDDVSSALSLSGDQRMPCADDEYPNGGAHATNTVDLWE